MFWDNWMWTNDKYRDNKANKSEAIINSKGKNGTKKLHNPGPEINFTYIVKWFLTRISGLFNRKRTVFPTNVVGKTVYLHAKEWS